MNKNKLFSASKLSNNQFRIVKIFFLCNEETYFFNKILDAYTEQVQFSVKNQRKFLLIYDSTLILLLIYESANFKQ